MIRDLAFATSNQRLWLPQCCVVQHAANAMQLDMRGLAACLHAVTKKSEQRMFQPSFTVCPKQIIAM